MEVRHSLDALAGRALLHKSVAELGFTRLFTNQTFGSRESWMSAAYNNLPRWVCPEEGGDEKDHNVFDTRGYPPGRVRVSGEDTLNKKTSGMHNRHVNVSIRKLSMNAKSID